MAYHNNNRRVNSQISGGNNNNARTVSYSGGLNERFSNLEKKKNTQNGGQPGNTNANSGGTVFSRLRGGKTALAKGRVNAIQNRLGKTLSGGIKKKGVSNVGGKKTRGVDKSSAARNASGRNRGGATASQRSGKKPHNGKVSKKPLTAEDLDKQMDAYMMKDKKTAQAKLDDELNSYMADAPALDLEDL